MATVERTFYLDEKIAKDLDNMISFDEQSQYINELLAKNILDENQRQVEYLIWNFAKDNPVQNPMSALSGVELIRQLREGDSRG